jgi:hypothetical protein
VFGAREAPSLRWELDGRAEEPLPVRPLKGAREAVGVVTAGQAHTGVYEFDAGIAPGSVHTVRAVATAGAEQAHSAAVDIRALPSRVPHRPGEAFTVLLVSCFHADQDKSGLAGGLVRELPAGAKPDLTLLMGDQVYLDLPLSRPRQPDRAALAREFEAAYRKNWAGDRGYVDVLAAAPSATVPDDHEYWNNAPHPATVVPLSHSRQGREAWYDAARAMFDAFQLGESGEKPEAERYNRTLEVSPLSLFFMDNRTHRREDLRASLPPGGIELFEDWAEDVRRRRLVGVIVTGQSLFQEPASGLRGAFYDRHLANYGDYPRIMAAIARLAEAGRSVLCLTGDVHYGRITRIRLDSAPARPIYEIIASPSSLVSSPQSTVTATRRWLQGHREQWPRHREAQQPPAVLTPVPGGPRWRLDSQVGVRGNHVATLAFRDAGPQVTVDVDFWATKPRGRLHDKARTIELVR